MEGNWGPKDKNVNAWFHMDDNKQLNFQNQACKW